MNRDLINKVSSCEPDNLIGGLVPKALKTGVNLSAGQGTLKRGTVLGYVEDENLVFLISAVAEGKTLTASFILAKDVDTGDKTGEAAVPAVAYQSGMFNRNELIVAEGYSLTLDDERALRTGGIYLTDSVN